MAYKNTVGPTIKFQSGVNSMGAGAVQGAKMGSSFGPWGMLIGAIIGTAVGGISSVLANEAMYKAALEQLEAADVANDKNLTTLGRQLSEIYRERTIEYNRAQSSLVYMDTKGNEANAQAINQYAAADQIGTALLYSTSYTQSQIDLQNWQTMFNLETAIENSNAVVRNLLKQTEGAFYTINVESEDDDWASILTGAIALENMDNQTAGRLSSNNFWSSGNSSGGGTFSLGGNYSNIGLQTPNGGGTGSFSLGGGSASSSLGF